MHLIGKPTWIKSFNLFSQNNVYGSECTVYVPTSHACLFYFLNFFGLTWILCMQYASLLWTLLSCLFSLSHLSIYYIRFKIHVILALPSFLRLHVILTSQCTFDSFQYNIFSFHYIFISISTSLLLVFSASTFLLLFNSSAQLQCDIYFGTEEVFHFFGTSKLTCANSVARPNI